MQADRADHDNDGGSHFFQTYDTRNQAKMGKQISNIAWKQNIPNKTVSFLQDKHNMYPIYFACMLAVKLCI